MHLLVARLSRQPVATASNESSQPRRRGIYRSRAWHLHVLTHRCLLARLDPLTVPVLASELLGLRRDRSGRSEAFRSKTFAESPHAVDKFTALV